MLIPVSREIFLPVIVWSLALGIISGAVYDIFRIRRAAFRIPGTRFLRGGKGRADTVLTFFEDILFSLFCTSVFILIAYRLSFGLPRWYSAAAYAGGFFLYRETVGVLVMRSAEAIIRALCRAVLFVYRRAICPAYDFIARHIGSFAGKISSRRRAAYTAKYEKHLVLSFTVPESSPPGSGSPRPGWDSRACCFCAVNIIMLRADYNDLRDREEELLREKQQYEDAIDKLRSDLDHEMDNDYIMRIAREKLNYYLPDEIIFYNDR